MTPWDDKPITKRFSLGVSYDVEIITSDTMQTTCKVKVNGKVFPDNGVYVIDKPANDAVGDAINIAEADARSVGHIQ